MVSSFSTVSSVNRLVSCTKFGPLQKGVPKQPEQPQSRVGSGLWVLISRISRRVPQLLDQFGSWRNCEKRKQ